MPEREEGSGSKRGAIAAQAFLAVPSVLSAQLQSLGAEFEADHSSYCAWLRAQLSKLLVMREMSRPLSELGCDWVTIHYLTRHPLIRGVDAAGWIGTGIPLGERMKTVENELQVYPDSVPPYFKGQVLAKRQKPVVVQFIPAAAWKASASGELRISGKVVELLKKKTSARGYEDPSFVVADLEAVEELQPGIGRRLRMALAALVGRDLQEIESLALLRDICRVTLLALSIERLGLELPRFVAICPTYAGESIIGGMALIGKGTLVEEDLQLFTAYSDMLLGRLRLLEEPKRELDTRKAEALNLARLTYLQRMTHGIREPLDALFAGVSEALEHPAPMSRRGDDGTQPLVVVLQAITQLRENTSHMMLTLAKDDVEELLHLKRRDENLAVLLNLTRFLYSPAFRKLRKELVVETPPKEWRLSIDRTAILEVISNLVGNALRYARSKVTVRTERLENPSRYHIIVSDDGRGVDPALASALFKTPGVHDPTEDASHGYGLYLGATIAARHGGALRLSSTGDGGAVFVLELPERDSSEEGEKNANESRGV
jgi:signal transduction histidine kinase